MRATSLACCLLAGGLLACGGSATSAQADAKKTAAGLTGDDKVAAVKNPQCQLFTPGDTTARLRRRPSRS